MFRATRFSKLFSLEIIDSKNSTLISIPRTVITEGMPTNKWNCWSVIGSF